MIYLLIFQVVNLFFNRIKLESLQQRTSEVLELSPKRITDVIQLRLKDEDYTHPVLKWHTST